MADMSKLGNAERLVKRLSKSDRYERHEAFKQAEKMQDKLPDGSIRDRWRAVAKAIWGYAGRETL